MEKKALAYNDLGGSLYCWGSRGEATLQALCDVLRDSQDREWADI